MNQSAAIAARARGLLEERAPLDRRARLGPVVLVGGISVVVTGAAVLSDLGVPFLAWDAYAYWSALGSANPYAGAAVGVIGSYLYPPPFLQVLAPLGNVPWPVFLFAWTAALTTVTVALLRRIPRTRRWLMPVLLIPAGLDIWAGNINVLLAYAIVVAVAHPAPWAPVAWAAVALTKVTPGVGMAWHALRGRWREAAVALLVTLALAAVSVALDRDLWVGWVGVMLGESPVAPYQATIHIPIYFRLPIALTILTWAARHDRPWLVPVACLIALPVIWMNGLSMLVGAAALLEARSRPASAPAAPRSEATTG